MKALIWIIILIVIGWGVWWFVNRGDDIVDNQPAAAAEGLEFGADASVDASDNPTDNPEMFDDKG